MFKDVLKENMLSVFLVSIICILTVTVAILLTDNQVDGDAEEIEANLSKLQIYESEEHIRNTSKEFIEVLLASPYDIENITPYMTTAFGNKYIDMISSETGEVSNIPSYDNNVQYDVGELNIENENSYTYTIRFQRDNEFTAGEVYTAKVIWSKEADVWKVSNYELNSIQVEK